MAKAGLGPEVAQIVQPASTLLGLARALATNFKRPGPVLALPPTQMVMPRVVIDGAHLARYIQVCGFAPAAQVPLTYPQLLTFPLVMAFMGSDACPWPAMGTVHLANTITQHAPLAAGDELQVELETGALQSHEKGQVFHLHLRLMRADPLQSACLWQATQTLLRVGVPSPVGPRFEVDLGPDLPLTQVASFEAPADIGRRYASVSGDYNPIHLWPLTAKWLGFQQAIAHGLWTQARALALIQADGVLPGFSLHTQFKRPLGLPAQATVWQASPDQQRQFEVRDATGQVPHLRSRLTPLHHSDPSTS